MKTLKPLIALSMLAVFVTNASAKSKNTGLYLSDLGCLNHSISYYGGNTKIEPLVCFTWGQDFRIFKNDKYRILSNSGIVIYSKSWLIQQGKGPKPTELYYFSDSPSGDILPLTIANLESVYWKNQKFIYAVESLFKSDSELSSYDAYNKQFKLAYLYIENTK
jgi:hypothetical protein